MLLFKLKKAVFILFLFGLLIPSFAQEKDSISVSQDSMRNVRSTHKKNYSAPRKASIMSAIIPGLGQAYNKKYWKIPVIYAGLAGFGYLFFDSNKEYNFYRKNLIADNDDDPATSNTTRYNSEQLQLLKVQYRKNRDFAAIGIAIFYLLNIIDANVDAHLKTFDVSDNLSVHIDPWQSTYHTRLGTRTATGLSIKFQFN